MSYYHGEADVHNFDRYNPTLYSGGYNIHLTYAHPLLLFDETCYPASLAFDGEIEYAHPQFSSSIKPSVEAMNLVVDWMLLVVLEINLLVDHL